jgi:hypothetical protein
MHVAAATPDVVSGPLTRREAARFLQLHPVTLAKWAQAGRGPRYVRTGERKGRTLYELDDLLEWLEQHKRSRP